jgi:HEAT repeat protein
MMNNFKDTLEHIATDPKLRTSHLYILSRMNQEALEIFKEIWPTIAIDRRRNVMQELMEITEANFEVDFDPVFLLGLGDQDAEVRATAIKSLWENEKPSLIRPLVHLLKNDEAAIVREAAASALGKFIYLRELEEIDWGEANLAEEALLETVSLAGEDLNVRRRAVESLGYSSDARIPAVIESAYYHENEKMQVSAIFAMGRTADSRWLPLIIEELDSSTAEMRYEAARACGELEAQRSVGQLIRLLEQDPDLEVQEMAIWALGRIGGPAAKSTLENYVESENETLALAAEDALDELNMFGDSLVMYDFSGDGDDDFDLDLNGNGDDDDFEDEFDFDDSDMYRH